jgi:branched-chain amino acid transport system substrate-binding protein
LMRAPFFAVSNPAMATFASEYQKRFGIVVDDNAVLAYEAINAVFESVKKSGSTDSEALVDALESITVNGLTGPLKFRALDHQCTAPLYVGITTASDKYPFKILTDVQSIQAEEIWPTPAEIEAARNKT